MKGLFVWFLVGMAIASIAAHFMLWVQYMKKWIYRMLTLLQNFGWRGLYAILLPVYWRQDVEFKNNGYDILSIRDNTGSYFYGTWKQNSY